MLQRFQSRPRSLLVVMALGAGLVGLACGGVGERQSVVGPAPAQPPAAATDAGTVTASAQLQRVQICHYDATTATVSDISLPENAITGHLAHGDVRGPCAAACPCFEAEHLAQTCSAGATLLSACPNPKYSYNGFCGYPGCSLCPSFNLGLMRVNPTERSCYREAWDSTSGNPLPVAFTNLTVGQIAACKALIVTSPYYPTSCPQ